MYETEIYLKSITENLPSDVWESFFDTQQSIKKRSVLHWTEHCTECAMPACFTTCDLYSPRIDGKCQRFVKGIEQVKSVNPNDTSPVLKVQFKQWGVFATQGNHELHDPEEVEKKEHKDHKIAQLIQLAQPKFLRKKLSQKRYSVKKNEIIQTQNQSLELPDAFLLDVYNPSSETLYLGIIVRNDDEKYGKLPFQYRLELKPGYNKEIIPFKEIARSVKTELPFRINLIPENINSKIPLYFGVMDFVQLNNYEQNTKASKLKCIVWDLDHTIWNGTLVEDGIENLKLKEGIKEILATIEQKGIINSVVSKNNPELGMEALAHFGLVDFFLYPKISWLPKSKGIREIAMDLNINLNTFMFVDDSIFERKEVENVLPQVRLMDAVDYREILDLEALQIPITSESKKRKEFYLNEVKRSKFSDDYEGEYIEFLKSCHIELEILELQAEHFDRVYELTQRTNQMNFSGNRYKQEDIEAIHKNADLAAYVLKCKDRFGDYGIIAFGVIKKTENRLIDLMFSCRVQSKRVEHAFLTYVLKKYLEKDDFWVTYNHTEKNKFSAQVFEDFGFETIKKEGSLRELKFSQDKDILDDHIISITNK
ncbi:HAD-IIIC family phosphatase [Reichenbachiella carrageenanivorans]|uniref:HAD-IIIC family phosphatase n=1 Tax=Reichenbachiella carrageenanivorans TaxID=2979869 RepID=A0ABY6D4X5_9BACT|nr:HAD-IIIC family phosphatase [Reichenbachiella carrageenanivorans]UXX81220.1 HAD-IIIC family phosphatase [Reichenbachiella carrageenanivorans]